MTSKLPDFWHVSPDKNKRHDLDNDETRSTQQQIRHRFIREVEKLKEDYETKIANNKGQLDENPPGRLKNGGKDTTEKDLANATFKCHVMQVKHALRELTDWYDWDMDYKTPDYKTVRQHIRKKHWWLYSPVLLNIVTFFTLVLGILEILVGIGYIAFPTAFIPGLRGKSAVPALFPTLEVVQGVFHIYCFIFGLALRKIKSWEIGVVILPLPIGLPWLTFVNLGLLIGVYIGCQDWRIIREMYRHLSLYNRHLFSRHRWDHYQSMMHCCGVEDYTDWFYKGPLLNALSDDFFHVPESCCKISGCTTPVLYGNNTGNNIYTSGCLKRTLICMNFILGFAAICVICSFIVSGLMFLTTQEANLYCHKGPLHYRDPLHRILFENYSITFINMDDKELLADVRLEKLSNLLNFYSYEIAKHIGLRKCIESINFEDNMDTIRRFLDFMQERPDLWDYMDAQMAMEDVENFLNNFESEKFELMQQSKPKDQERFMKSDLVRNSELNDDDESDSSNESSTQPTATAKIVDLIAGNTGTLVSPQEVAEVMYALRLNLNKQEEGKIVHRLAEKLSTIYEADEALQSDSEHGDSKIVLPEDKVPPGTRSTNNVISPNQFKSTHPNNVQSTPNVKAQSQSDDKTQNSEGNKAILKENDKSQEESKPPEEPENIPSPIPQTTPEQPIIVPNDTPETPVKETVSDSSANN